MKTGYVLFIFIFPILLEGCCQKKSHQKKITGPRQDIRPRYYRAVEGETFMMPCIVSSNTVWFRTGEGEGGNQGPSFNCSERFSAEAKHSGNYTSLTGGSKLVLHLQVVKKINEENQESSKILPVDQGGEVLCPGLTRSNKTDVVWYKGNRAVSEQPRPSCEKEGKLRLCQVFTVDAGVYFCDRQIIEDGVSWTFRRAVHVTVIPLSTRKSPPRILHPDRNTIDEVELGRLHTLTCRVYFPFEINFLPKMQWYMNYNGNMENMTLLHMESQGRHNSFRPKRVKDEFEVIQTATIKEVRPQDLNHTYTCIASNTVGNSSVTIKLKRRMKVKWPWLVGYPIVPFLLVAGLGIIVHVKWLELQIIYRSHFQYGKYKGDEKEFDVLLSYVSSPPSTGSDPSSRARPNDIEEACPSSTNLLNTEEGEATQRPLEELLPQVLEGQWGYRLCLMERDVLPGGAYTNDVVLAIKRSRMLICILSADYLNNTSAVFVLESGVQALLQKSGLKLLLIWTSRATAGLIQPDPPLPTLVQRALRVLPSLDWSSGKPDRATGNFWRSLKKVMPNHREQGYFH